MKILRFGVIGFGNMGSAHAVQLFRGKVEGAVLAAVCDINADRIAQAVQCFDSKVQTYTEYQALLDSGSVDAVLIATPHRLHPPIAVAAFARGIHVLTEKPAGIDIKSVRQMNLAAKQSGKIFGIMYNQRTNPLFGLLREYVQSGKLGEIKRFVWIVNNWYRTQAYYDSGDWRATWRGEGGGVLINQCPHNLDIWQWIMGMPKKVRAFCTNGHYHNIDVEDDVTIYAEYENSATAVFITSTGEYPGTNRLEISGSRGKAVLENGSLKLYLLEQDERVICFSSKEGMPREKVDYKVVEQDHPETGHLGILQNFTNAVLYGEHLLAPGEEGINGLTLSNAAYLSTWMDEWVLLPFEEEMFCRMLEERQAKEIPQRKLSIQENMTGEYIERWAVRW